MGGRPVVIGITGKIGAGKDTIANYLVRQHHFRVVRFSDPLKQEVLDTIPRTLRQIFRKLHDGAEPSTEDLRQMLWHDKPPIVRELLQEWGTELRRAEDPDYWVVKWTKATSGFLKEGVSVVAPDMRFNNEMAAVTKFESAYTIRVIRPGTVVGTHRSEVELDGVRVTKEFDNSGSLLALYSDVEDFLTTIQLNGGVA
jgi:hypothetical protein